MRNGISYADGESSSGVRSSLFLAIHAVRKHCAHRRHYITKPYLHSELPIECIIVYTGVCGERLSSRKILFGCRGDGERAA